jgi:hypothetical protein
MPKSDSATPTQTYPVRMRAGVSLVLSIIICPEAQNMPPTINAFKKSIVTVLSHLLFAA